MDKQDVWKIRFIANSHEWHILVMFIYNDIAGGFIVGFMTSSQQLSNAYFSVVANKPYLSLSCFKTTASCSKGSSGTLMRTCNLDFYTNFFTAIITSIFQILAT